MSANVTLSRLEQEIQTALAIDPTGRVVYETAQRCVFPEKGSPRVPFTQDNSAESNLYRAMKENIQEIGDGAEIYNTAFRLIYDEEWISTASPTAWIDEILRNTMPSSPTNPRTPPNTANPIGIPANNDTGSIGRAHKTSRLTGASIGKKQEISNQKGNRTRGGEASTTQQSALTSSKAKRAREGDRHGHVERLAIRDSVGGQVDHAAEIEKIAYGRKSSCP